MLILVGLKTTIILPELFPTLLVATAGVFGNNWWQKELSGSICPWTSYNILASVANASIRRSRLCQYYL